MAEIVTIRPKADSRKFRSMQGRPQQFQKMVDNTGKQKDVNVGDYKSERFPNSRQIFRIEWSLSKKRWIVEGFEGDMTLDKQKELDKMAKACKLKYPKGDPREKHPIESADMYDPADPFFNHKNLKVISSEGQLTLHVSSPIDKIILKGLSLNNEFQKGGIKTNPVLSQRTRYIITDRDIDTKIKTDERNTAMKASQLYASLSDDKKIKIAMAMGLVAQDNVDRALVDDALWDASVDTKTKVHKNLTKRDYFIAMCSATSEEINTRHMIQQARAKGKLKNTKDQGWLLFGTPIGRNEDQLFSYFSNPDNQEMLVRLEEALKE